MSPRIDGTLSTKHCSGDDQYDLPLTFYEAKSYKCKGMKSIHDLLPKLFTSVALKLESEIVCSPYITPEEQKMFTFLAIVTFTNMIVLISIERDDDGNNDGKIDKTVATYRYSTKLFETTLELDSPHYNETIMSFLVEYRMAVYDQLKKRGIKRY